MYVMTVITVKFLKINQENTLVLYLLLLFGIRLHKLNWEYTWGMSSLFINYIILLFSFSLVQKYHQNILRQYLCILVFFLIS